MLDGAGARAVVTDPALRARPAGGPADRARRPERRRSSPPRSRPASAGPTLDGPVSGEALAYVLYTSGSTGAPKGAMVEHRGMLNHLHAKVRDLGLTADDTLAQTAPLGFDISVWQFLAPLLAGGRVWIADEATARDPVLLLDDGGARGRHRARGGALVAPGDGRCAAAGRGRRRARPPPLAHRHRGAAAARPVPPLARRATRDAPRERLRAHRVLRRRDPSRHRPRAGGGRAAHPGRPATAEHPDVRARRRARPVPPGVAARSASAGPGWGAATWGARTSPRSASSPTRSATRPGGASTAPATSARYRPDGALEYLGRADHQVKVRGAAHRARRDRGAAGRAPGAARGRRADGRRSARRVRGAPRGGAGARGAAAFLRRRLPEEHDSRRLRVLARAAADGERQARPARPDATGARPGRAGPAGGPARRDRSRPGAHVGGAPRRAGR